MKKILSGLFLTLATITQVHAAAGISRPVIESLSNPTTNGFTVDAFSTPAFKGNREWSFVFSSTTNTWFEVKNIPAIRTVNSDPAPANCTESTDLGCSFRINAYQLRSTLITCETTYSVVLRVRSLDDNTVVDSPRKTIRTKPCAAQGKPSFVKSNVARGSSDSTGKLVLNLNTSEFPGKQTAEISIAVEPKDGFQGTNFTLLGSAEGTNTISLEKEIPGVDIICGVDELRYVVKVKIAGQDFFWPESRQGVLLRTECASGIVDNNGGAPEITATDRYTFLTPLPLGEGLTSQDSIIIGTAGDAGILGILQRIFTLMLIAAVVLAVVFMIIGGARYATADKVGGVQGGREIITNAITGLLFALFAWLLLNIINPDLLRFTITLPNIGKALTPGGNTPEGNIITGEGCGADVSKEECFALITADEARVRALLASGGITINKEPCSRPDVGDCTNVGLLSNTTSNRLLVVKADCVAVNPQCEMVITGGTEYWLHSEGGNHKQFTAVDLRIGGASFDTFIKTKEQVQPTPNFCNEAFYYKGLRFCNEKGSPAHWHVDTIGTNSGGSSNTGGLLKFENIGANNLGVWGKASGQPMTITDAKALANGARSKSWYTEVQRVAGNDAKTLTAIIMVESTGNPDATRTEPNGSKSCGLGQILTETAKGLDASLRTKSVEEICTKLKEPNYNIRLSYQYYRGFSGDFKKKVAAYNGGVENQGATGVSQNCSGLMRFECPWDSSGCYDKTKPNDKPSNTSCTVNTGYEVTRFYVDKVKKVADQL